MDSAIVGEKSEFKLICKKISFAAENLENFAKHIRNKDKEIKDCQDEIIENDYNLNIPRYVDTSEEEEIISLADVSNELEEVDAQIEESYASLLNMFKQLNSESEEMKKELESFIKMLEK